MAPTGIRDRFRAQMVDEIKQLALRQLAEGGPQALSVNAIAKDLGVSGPALYRYFANRDALLTELILDGYADLTAALRSAEPGIPGLADAYRAWATANPHRYRLLFGAPLPGYEAHDERLVAAAQQSMDVLLDRIPAGPAPGPELAEPDHRVGTAAGPRRCRSRCRAACAHRVEPAARRRDPGDRGELRLDGPGRRPALRRGGRLAAVTDSVMGHDPPAPGPSTVIRPPYGRTHSPRWMGQGGLHVPIQPRRRILTPVGERSTSR